MVVVAACVGVPLLLAFAVVGVVAGWPDVSGVREVVVIVCFLAGAAAILTAWRTGLSAIRAPVAAVGGDGPRARRIRRAVARGRVPRLSSDDAGYAVPWARATLAGTALGRYYFTEFLLGFGPLQLSNLATPGQEWWQPVSAAAFLVVFSVALVATGWETRRLRRFLADADPVSAP